TPATSAGRGRDGRPQGDDQAAVRCDRADRPRAGRAGAGGRVLRHGPEPDALARAVRSPRLVDLPRAAVLRRSDGPPGRVPQVLDLDDPPGRLRVRRSPVDGLDLRREHRSEALELCALLEPERAEAP